MGAIASQITSPTIVYSIVYLDADQRKHQSSASLAFVWGIHRGPVNSPHKWPVTRKKLPFDDVIMCSQKAEQNASHQMASLGPTFCLFLGVSSGCARPITGQVTSVTWPVIGWAQSELTPSRIQKTGPGQNGVKAIQCRFMQQEPTDD